jgi:hypothetical protein
VTQYERGATKYDATDAVAHTGQALHADCSESPVTVSPAPKSSRLTSVFHSRVALNRTHTSRRRIPVFALLSLGALLAACTLTSDDFQPVRSETENLTPEIEPVGPAAPNPCPGAAECCDALACGEGLVCRAGACEPGPDAGSSSCDPSECPLTPELPLVQSCEDDRLNQDETDVDCGGSCAQSCGAGQLCQLDSDCGDGFFCATSSSRCQSVSCSDEVRNGDELGIDCGGGLCAGCAPGTECNTGIDCDSGACGADGRCAAPSCGDGVKNQDEVDVDCGGSCLARCEAGRACTFGISCQSGVCGAEGCEAELATCCQAPSCDDGIRNGDEPSTDCGNFACGLCAVASICTQNVQCQTGLCQFGRCATPSTCVDRVQNGTETSVDCGGSNCPRCGDLAQCQVDTDCSNNNCDPGGTCISCGDNRQNGTETGVDCGGSDPFCRRCIAGERCLNNTDCASLFCQGGFC